MISQQPAEVSTCALVNSVTIEILAEGPGPLAYQWQAADPASPGQWSDVLDGVDQELGTVVGAQGSSLQLTGVSSERLLRCAVTNLCGETFSNTVAVTLGGPDCCLLADFNGDGILDNGDILVFINAFIAADPAADVNGDGVVGNDDIGGFIAAFLAGC